MPFKPGKDWNGNANGRPKKENSLTQLMRDYLDEVDPDTQQERKWDFVEATFKKAKEGDVAAKKIIWNYLEGMPKQEIKAEGDMNINITSYGDQPTS